MGRFSRAGRAFGQTRLAGMRWFLRTKQKRSGPTSGAALQSTDGPYAETKEQLGGVYILDCADMDEAMSFAEKMPCAVHGNG